MLTSPASWGSMLVWMPSESLNSRSAVGVFANWRTRLRVKAHDGLPHDEWKSMGPSGVTPESRVPEGNGAQVNVPASRQVRVTLRPASPPAHHAQAVHAK